MVSPFFLVVDMDDANYHVTYYLWLWFWTSKCNIQLDTKFGPQFANWFKINFSQNNEAAVKKYAWQSIEKHIIISLNISISNNFQLWKEE